MNLQLVRTLFDLRHVLRIYLATWPKRNRGEARRLQPPPRRGTLKVRIACALAREEGGVRSQCYAACGLCL